MYYVNTSREAYGLGKWPAQDPLRHSTFSRLRRLTQASKYQERLSQRTLGCGVGETDGDAPSVSRLFRAGSSSSSWASMPNGGCTSNMPLPSIPPTSTSPPPPSAALPLPLTDVSALPRVCNSTVSTSLSPAALHTALYSRSTLLASRVSGNQMANLAALQCLVQYSTTVACAPHPSVEGATCHIWLRWAHARGASTCRMHGCVAHNLVIVGTKLVRWVDEHKRALAACWAKLSVAHNRVAIGQMSCDAFISAHRVHQARMLINGALNQEQRVHRPTEAGSNAR